MPACNRRTFLTVSGAVLGGIAAGTTVTAATRADRYLVRTSGTAPPAGVEVVHEMPGVDVSVVRATESDLDQSNAVKAYAPDVAVTLADPDVNSEAPVASESTVADESLYPLQWDKQALDVSTAHETTTGAGTRVAVIDSGVAAGHPDLTVNTALSRNFTDDGFGAGVPAGGYHGTHVAGIVGADDNGGGVIGTAPDTELVDCRVFRAPQRNEDVGASFGDILAAVVYSAAIDADVANLSLGAYPIPRQSLSQFYGTVLNSVMTYANKEGTLLVLSAGNNAADLQHDKNLISLPNEGAQGMSIAATGPIGFAWDPTDYGGSSPAVAPAVYTNYGTNAVDLAAPGGNYSLSAYAEANDGDNVSPPWFYDLVLNTVAIPQFEYERIPDDDNEEDDEYDYVPVEYLGATYDYSWVAGTSMAAPNVAGAAALVKSANPSYNANQVESALERAASVPDGYDKSYYGSGFLNVTDAL